jgi:hypothetical protein
MFLKLTLLAELVIKVISEWHTLNDKKDRMFF